MKKMTTLFVVDRSTDLAIDEIRPENEWVIKGEGIATVKMDGTACLVSGGVLFKRQNRKLQKRFQKKWSQSKQKGTPFSVDESMFKSVPDGTIACNDSFDPVTLHWPFWVPVNDEAPEDAFHVEGWNNLKNKVDGTYELMGPKFQGNLLKLDQHQLMKHGEIQVTVTDFSFEGICSILKKLNHEGLVFHNADGRMCKIRRKDMFEFKDLTGGRKLDWRDENLIL
jgi:hypothetical protein